MPRQAHGHGNSSASCVWHGCALRGGDDKAEEDDAQQHDEARAQLLHRGVCRDIPVAHLRLQTMCWAQSVAGPQLLRGPCSRRLQIKQKGGHGKAEENVMVSLARAVVMVAVT